MRLNKTDFLRKAQHPLLMGLASLPASMLLILTTLPDIFSWCWCFPAAFVLSAWVCLLVPGRRRLLAAAAAATAMLGSAFTLLPWQAPIPLLLLPVMYIALLLCTLPIGGWPYNRELAVGWHIGGILSHLILQVLINGSRLTGKCMYDPAQTPLLISFLAYAALVLMTLNRTSLDSAAQSRRKVPLLMQRQNRIMTLGLLLIGGFVAAIPAIGSALGTAWDFIMTWLLRLVSFLASLIPLQSSGRGVASGGSTGDMGLGESQPPSAFALLMEKIIGIAAMIVVVIALILLSYAACKKLRKLFKLLWERMLHYSAASSEDYTDEITSTRDEADTDRESLLTHLRRTVPFTEKGHTPAEQVRLRYKQLKLRHKSWRASATARETLSQEAAALYERARYAGHELTEAEALRFKEGTKRL